MHGIINVYKEKGFTSHDVVAKLRGILREKKIGHTGTLDPEAEGVLPVCIGKATKVVPFLTDCDKCYEAEVILGATTTTEDATGEIVETFDINVTSSQIEEVVQQFVGQYTQIPPMYSAIKVNGVRLYELARKGIEVERPSREVQIYSCDIIEPLENNKFKIRVKCSKGTYIRTLCTDIGKKLGCGAHMGYLLRTQVGNYYLDNSLKLSQIEQQKNNIFPYLQSIEDVFFEYPKLTVKNEASKSLYNGNPLNCSDIVEDNQNLNFARIYDTQKNFIGIYKQKENLWVVEKIFFDTTSK
ncbi:MAG: tRNA pseudouridine(55) synthase TruB [Epulopiscium sp. Nele67-Bin005]|nr:MAG: tRNA pseudouridine(55) synthase TruB [Epulopiscium sp. Nele67-Bin005]